MDRFNLRKPLERFKFFFQFYNLLYDLQRDCNLSNETKNKIMKLALRVRSKYPDTFTSSRTHGGDSDGSEPPAKRAHSQTGEDRGAGSKARWMAVYNDGGFLAAFEKLGYKLDEEEDEEAFPDWQLLNEVRFAFFPPWLCLLILHCSYHRH